MSAVRLGFLTLGAAAILLGTPGPSPAGDEHLDAWSRFARSREAGMLILWMRETMYAVVTGEGRREPLRINAPSFYGRLGLFVTLVNKNKVRGCFGAFDHRAEDLELVLSEYLRGALRCDPRYAPLDVSELEDSGIILTVAGPPYPVGDLADIDLARCGVVISFEGGDRMVFVPREVRSSDHLKKRIQGRDVDQISAFRTVVISDARGAEREGR